LIAFIIYLLFEHYKYFQALKNSNYAMFSFENRRRDVILWRLVFYFPHKKGCLLDCLDWVPNRGACIDACLSYDVTRSFRNHDIKALCYVHCEYQMPAEREIVRLMPRLHLTVLQPGTKPDVCGKGFPSFKIQISCLQF